MKISVKLLKPFSDIAGRGEVGLDFEEGTATRALEQLCELYPDLKQALFEEDGQISYSVNVFVNDRPLIGSEEERQLSEGDELLVFMAVSGG
ncbi:MAG: MoaD/ThiS family protein [Thermoplasmata archaeon]|nr:MAG: MoaD/ThiS family protein [Thermoplasmata archaeon]